MLTSVPTSFISIAVSLLAMSGSALGAECAPQYAPSTFEFKGDPTGATKNLGDRGIVPTGFVLLSDNTPTAQGIDASKYQGSVDFEQIKTCGGQFAFIRLSSGTNPENELEYRALWANSRSVGLLTGPYHHLSLQDINKPFSTLPADLQEKTTALAIEEARSQANLFKTRLQEVLELDVKTSNSSGGLGHPYLPPALDLSFRPQSSYSAADQLAYGKVYGEAACAFITAIRDDHRFAGQEVVLFTTPSIFHDFGLARASCGLNKQRVWISDHNQNGDRPHADRSTSEGTELRELCGPDIKQCLFQQYTSFGGFALFRSEPGLDMDRFFGTYDDLAKAQVQARQ